MDSSQFESLRRSYYELNFFATDGNSDLLFDANTEGMG